MFCEEKVCDASRSGLAAGSHRLTTPQCYSYIDPDSHTRFLSHFCPVIPVLVSLSRSVRPGSHGGGAGEEPRCPRERLRLSVHHFKHCIFPTSHYHHYHPLPLHPFIIFFAAAGPRLLCTVSRVSLLSLSRSLLNYGQQSAIL